LEEGARADLMAASVARAARAAGLDDAGFELLARAHALAMRPRIAALEDDHHPAYLHPGRAVLLLLRDVGPLPASTLAAAAVHETVDDDLRASEEAVRDELGDEVADLVASLPASGDEGLAERLVTLDEQARLAALAERLDQLRHAHLRPDLEWRAAWEEAQAVWLPVAERTHPRLADRFRNWHRAYGRRLR
jgi:(p)ppGpp synthase/HD superfamily hydrolase